MLAGLIKSVGFLINLAKSGIIDKNKGNAKKSVETLKLHECKHSKALIVQIYLDIVRVVNCGSEYLM